MVFRHEHLFDAHPMGSNMIDRIVFDAPFGLLGDVTEKIVLGSYLPKLVVERNSYLRDKLEAHR